MHPPETSTNVHPLVALHLGVPQAERCLADVDGGLTWFWQHPVTPTKGNRLWFTVQIYRSVLHLPPSQRLPVIEAQQFFAEFGVSWDPAWDKPLCGVPSDYWHSTEEIADTAKDISRYLQAVDIEIPASQIEDITRAFRLGLADGSHASSTAADRAAVGSSSTAQEASEDFVDLNPPATAPETDPVDPGNTIDVGEGLLDHVVEYPRRKGSSYRDEISDFHESPSPSCSPPPFLPSPRLATPQFEDQSIDDPSIFHLIPNRSFTPSPLPTNAPSLTPEYGSSSQTPPQTTPSSAHAQSYRGEDRCGECRRLDLQQCRVPPRRFGGKPPACEACHTRRHKCERGKASRQELLHEVEAIFEGLKELRPKPTTPTDHEDEDSDLEEDWQLCLESFLRLNTV